MIANLTGKITVIKNNYLVLEVNGVGYKVENYAPYRLGLEGAEVKLEIYTHVSERELRLFGFGNINELELFEKLLGVSGVGPKSAMILISTFSVRQIVEAIINKDPSTIVTKGISSKTSAKVIIELSGKVENFTLGEANKSKSISLRPESDLISALENLGYLHKDFSEILKQVDNNLAFSAQLKMALALLSNSK